MTAVPKAEEDPSSRYLKPEGGNKHEETYMLQCLYCDWSTLDIDVTFNKPTKITEQLVKQRKAQRAPTESTDKAAAQHLEYDDAFARLTAFYKDQLSESSDAQGAGYGSSPYGSPANLQRIMSLYGGLSANALKKSREKPQPMREAHDQSEGLCTFLPDADLDQTLIDRLQEFSWDETVSSGQRVSAPPNQSSRLKHDLWPIATQLRTRKGKRCKICRQFVSRPDNKVSGLRWKIRIPAAHHIPQLSFTPLQAAVPPVPNPAFRLKAEDPVAAPLKPGLTLQYVLTVKNPIFENVKINLATPAVTPGNVESKVTILCPSFTVGPAGDVWDEALSSTASTTSSGSASRLGSREAAMASLTGKAAGEDVDRQPEAGKVWEKTRNTTSVIIEIVPGQRGTEGTNTQHKDEALEDDDVVEVPIFVRAEWEVPAEGLHDTPKALDETRTKDGKVRVELGYWCVLGVGKTAAG